MNFKVFTLPLIVIICFVSALGLTACGQSTAAPLPSVSTASSPTPETVMPTPAVTPTLLPSVIASPLSSANPAVSPSPSVTPSSTSSPSPSPSPVAEKKPAEITTSSNKATLDFPNSVTFVFSGASALPVTNITLEYGTKEHSVVDEIIKVQPAFNPGSTINTSYTWDMRKTPYIPPKAEIWYQWRFQDEAKREFTTPKTTVVFEDTRFQWKLESAPSLDIYYHDQDSAMIKDLLSGTQSNLSRIKLDTVIPPERKIKILIYRNYDEVKSSGLFKQDWIGGQAFPNYNVIILAVNSSNLNWAKGGVPHEITHLIVHETVFGPFGDIPRWLDEGLAMFSEGQLAAEYNKYLDTAVRENSIMSVRSISSQFPTDANKASLAYAESNSVVSYLIETYGWDKIKTLLETFKDGSTYDNALKKVYNFDTGGLDKEWKAKIGANL
jgi:hypothetical protein